MEKASVFCMGIGILLLFLFTAPLFSNGKVNIGTVTGVLLSLAFLLYGRFMPAVHEAWDKAFQTAGGRLLLSAVTGLALLVLVTAAWETALMVRAARNKPPENTTAVVLGCSVKGRKPSRILRERLEAAYAYLAENPGACAVLSGGRGRGEEISEAECMFAYLTAKGIDQGRLFLEDASSTTRENLMFSKEILRQKGLGDRIAIITSEFHAYRAGEMAGKLGLESYSAPSRTCLLYLPTYYVRELYGILYYGIRQS